MRIDYQLRGGSIARMLRAMLRTTSSAAAMSGAASQLLAEPQGLAIDFTDSYFFASTGRYGSAEVKDLGTPANNFDSVPDDLLSFTGTTKLTRSADGVLRYQRHNLFTYSEASTGWTATNVTPSLGSSFPAVAAASIRIVEDSSTNIHRIYQILNVTNGVSYAVGFRVLAQERFKCAIREATVTGAYAAFNVTAGTVLDSGGGATAVSITPDTNGFFLVSLTFTATTSGVYTVSFHLLPDTYTSGSVISTYAGDSAKGLTVTCMHARRTPADSTYVATTTAAKFGLPYEWGVNLTDGTNNTQTVTVHATTSAYNKTTYLVSYDGAGSVALSGGATGAVASGAPFYITSSTTSLVLTVTGSISNLQVREFFGVLIEPQATNYTFPAYGNGASNSYSTGSIFGISTYPAIATGRTGAPDGTATATRLTWAGVLARFGTTQASSGLHVPDQNGNAAAGLWVRSISGTVTGVSLNLRSTITPNIASQALTITPEWQRVYVTRATVAGQGTTGWYLAADGSQDIEVWGYQLEPSSIVSSQIITYDASVTRAADNISLATSAFPLGGTYSAYVAATVMDATYVVSAPFLALDDASTANRIRIANASSTHNAYIRAAASDQAAISIGTPVANSPSKYALAAATNNARFAANGTLGPPDTTITMPSGLTTLRIGSIFGGGQPVARIQQVMLVPRAWTDVELQSRTAA